MLIVSLLFLFSVFSCECPPEWAGPSCEFEEDARDEEYEDCQLDCLNGGHCRKGAKNTVAMTSVNEDLASATHDENFEHCVCPAGYTGLRCQYKYEECGNKEHICLHGTKCVAPSAAEGRPTWTCDCGDSQSGTFCQHHRTSTCTSEDSSQSIYRGMLSVAYCVNDGVCAMFEEDGVRYVIEDWFTKI